MPLYLSPITRHWRSKCCRAPCDLPLMRSAKIKCMKCEVVYPDGKPDELAYWSDVDEWTRVLDIMET